MNGTLTEEMKEDIKRCDGEINVKYLLERKDLVSLADTKGNTVAHIAAIYGKGNFLRLLGSRLRDFAQVTNEMGKTPLHEAVLHNSDPSDVELLINSGADINKRELYTGNTALHNSLKDSCHVTLTEKLLKMGADPNIQNEDGDTSLHFAHETEQLDIVKMLCKAGADLEIRNKNRKTVLARKKPHNILRYFRNEKQRRKRELKKKEQTEAPSASKSKKRKLAVEASPPHVTTLATGADKVCSLDNLAPMVITPSLQINLNTISTADEKLSSTKTGSDNGDWKDQIVYTGISSETTNARQQQIAGESSFSDSSEISSLLNSLQCQSSLGVLSPNQQQESVETTSSSELLHTTYNFNTEDRPNAPDSSFQEPPQGIVYTETNRVVELNQLSHLILQTLDSKVLNLLLQICKGLAPFLANSTSTTPHRNIKEANYTEELQSTISEVSVIQTLLSGIMDVNRQSSDS